MINKLYQEALELLKKLVSTPSLSKEENLTADILADFIHQKGYTPQRHLNNVWVVSKDFSADKPTILLNSHHDTVKPNAGWTLEPYQALEKEGKLYGLGSNDAGASLIALLIVFFELDKESNKTHNFIWAGTAEEEISGANGIASILDKLGKIDLGIVGEPTQMQMAVAERGLVVMDGIAYGKAGHAAREEGDNAIYKAMKDIEWIRTYQFSQVSDMLGKVKMSVTQIEAGTQHNVVPDVCKFVVDVRVNELYSNQEVFETIQAHTESEIKARSLRLNSSQIDLEHPIVQKGESLGMSTYGSPTLSDQALMPFTTLKIGVGDSARSHTADEFIYLKELEEGITLYLRLLDEVEE
jgi:acetylornithine deacetylase